MKKEKVFGLPVKYVTISTTTLMLVVIGKDLWITLKDILFYIFSNEIIQYLKAIILGLLVIIGTIIFSILLFIAGVIFIIFLYSLIVEGIAQLIKDIQHRL